MSSRPVGWTVVPELGLIPSVSVTEVCELAAGEKTVRLPGIEIRCSEVMTWAEDGMPRLRVKIRWGLPGNDNAHRWTKNALIVNFTAKEAIGGPNLEQVAELVLEVLWRDIQGLLERGK